MDKKQYTIKNMRTITEVEDEITKARKQCKEDVSLCCLCNNREKDNCKLSFNISSDKMFCSRFKFQH